MAGTGKKVKFHGAYKSKKSAQAKERKVGGYIKTITVRGHKRYAVLTRRTK